MHVHLLIKHVLDSPARASNFLFAVVVCPVAQILVLFAHVVVVVIALDAPLKVPVVMRVLVVKVGCVPTVMRDGDGVWARDQFWCSC